MTIEQGAPAPKPSRKRILLLGFLGFAALVLVLGIIGAVADSGASKDTAAAATSTTTAAPITAPPATAAATPSAAPPAPVAPPASSPAAVPAPVAPVARSPRCQPVPDRYLAIVNAGFTNSTYTLANSWAINGADGMWIGGHIMDGDKRVSSADVWYAKGPAVWSLSGGARRNSQLPDGRHTLNLSAGDEDGIAVQGCVTAR